MDVKRFLYVRLSIYAGRSLKGSWSCLQTGRGGPDPAQQEADPTSPSTSSLLFTLGKELEARVSHSLNASSSSLQEE
jgi:hypothetical protein